MYFLRKMKPKSVMKPKNNAHNVMLKKETRKIGLRLISEKIVKKAVKGC